eukprot:607826-Pyramimonas_sp.AAC.1
MRAASSTRGRECRDGCRNRTTKQNCKERVGESNSLSSDEVALQGLNGQCDSVGSRTRISAPHRRTDEPTRKKCMKRPAQRGSRGGPEGVQRGSRG